MTKKEYYKIEKLISNTDRLIRHPSDDFWQHEFNLRKSLITPLPLKERLNSKFRFGASIKSYEESVDKETGYQHYLTFLNDVSRNIRKGKVDFCYYIFQIEDLLKYHYDNLHTCYDPKTCSIAVWLDPVKLDLSMYDENDNFLLNKNNNQIDLER